MNVPFEAIQIFGTIDFVEDDTHYIFYPERPISRDNRKKLKEMGFILSKHSRTKKDIWIYDKKEINHKNDNSSYFKHNSHFGHHFRSYGEFYACWNDKCD